MNLSLSFAFVVLLLLMGALLVVAVLRIMKLVRVWLPFLFRAGLSLPLVRRFSAHGKAMAFLRSRFSPAESLGLHLTLGLLLSLVFAWIFSEIAEDMRGATLVFVDRVLLDIINRFRTPLVTDFFMRITVLGSWEVVFPCSCLIVLAFLIARRQTLLIGYLSVIGGGVILNQVLKAVYVRSRPPHEQAVAVVAGWSFPSGHAMTAVAFYGTLVYLLFVLVRRTSLRVGGALIAFVLVLLIGISRIYIGVHYLTDIIAGYAAGALWLTVSITAVETYRKRGGHRKR